jgi:hypothetical protein
MPVIQCDIIGALVEYIYVIRETPGSHHIKAGEARNLNPLPPGNSTFPPTMTYWRCL